MPSAEPLLAGDVDDIFRQIEGRFRETLDALVLRQDERPFEFQHQRAGGHRRDNVVALIDVRREGRRDLARGLGDFADQPLLQLRHAAAMRMHDFRLDAIFRQHGERRLADGRIVIIAVAGGVEHGLATLGRTSFVARGRIGGDLGFERRARIFRQFGVAVEAGDFLLKAAQRAAPARRPIGGAGDESRELAVAVGLGQFAVGEGYAVLLRLDGAIAQDQMRKVDVEFMRRHIGAFRHEAHVAERAGVDDLLEIRARDRVEFAAFRTRRSRSKSRGKESQRLKQRRQL